MNVSLTRELEQFIAEKVATGMYGSASEVVRESLRLLKEQDDLSRLKRSELQRDLQVAAESLKKGEFTRYPDADTMMDDLEARATARIAERKRQ